MAVYALIDSSQRVGFHRRLEDRRIGYRSLFEGQAEQKHPEIAPLLLQWPGDNHDVQARRVRDDIQRLARDRPAVSIIESAMTMAELSGHLRRFHLVKLPNGREMLLRWYDTRVLPAWASIMTTSQAAGFFAGINRWRMHDRYGEEVDLDLRPGDAGELPAPPYSLDQGQYASLIEACGADVLIAHLRDVIPDEIRRLAHRDLYPFVVDHLDAARRHGLESLDDQAQYLLLALYTSGEFLTHHHVRERLENSVQDHDEDFSTWAMGVPDEVFELGEPLWSKSERV